MSIKGNPVGTTTPRPDWNQNNPKKADFIKNKPDIPVIDITLKQAGKAADAKAVGDALTALPSGGGEAWELIRDDTLTEEVTGGIVVSTDADDNTFALKKLMIEIYTDTNNGVYTSGNVILFLYKNNSTKTPSRIGFIMNAFPTANGKCGYVRIDTEFIGTNAFATFSAVNNKDGFLYSQMEMPSNLMRSQACPLDCENITIFKVDSNVPMHSGTRIVVWGVKA